MPDEQIDDVGGAGALAALADAPSPAKPAGLAEGVDIARMIAGYDVTFGAMSFHFRHPGALEKADARNAAFAALLAIGKAPHDDLELFGAAYGPEIAARCVESWRGVSLGDGPAPITLENALAVFRIEPVFQAVYDQYVLLVLMYEREKER